MAGINKSGEFPEKISPFLKNKMAALYETLGEQSAEYRALYNQYVRQDVEKFTAAESNRRHWEADLKIDAHSSIQGVERLYTQTAVIEPTMVCASHCRYCLRANYQMFTLSEEELMKIAQYCGSEDVRDTLSEVLVSGGDPFVVPKRLKYLVDAIIHNAPNIQRIRIATRLPLHDPNRVDSDIYEIFRQNSDKIRFEVATQINHPVELFPESREVFKKLRSIGIKVYSQNVLIKGVNDNINALVELYRLMRDQDIEAHYLFHSVPMKGMHHLRTSVQRGIDLALQLTNSGKISGRAKPIFALMTDIGKVTLYHGTIVKKTDDNYLLLKTSYNYADRMKLNPQWILPETASVAEDGTLMVKYLDGIDD
jgi:lysine 2,3-aminomutase